MSEPNEVKPVPSPPRETIIPAHADAINAGYQQLQAMGESALDLAIRIGAALQKKKAELKHGEWIPWVQENLKFSERQARRFLALAVNRPALSDLDTPEDAYKFLTLSRAGDWYERGREAGEPPIIEHDQWGEVDFDIVPLPEKIPPECLVDKAREITWGQLAKSTGVAVYRNVDGGKLLRVAIWDDLLDAGAMQSPPITLRNPISVAKGEELKRKWSESKRRFVAAAWPRAVSLSVRGREAEALREVGDGIDLPESTAGAAFAIMTALPTEELDERLARLVGRSRAEVEQEAEEHHAGVRVTSSPGRKDALPAVVS